MSGGCRVDWTCPTTVFAVPFPSFFELRVGWMSGGHGLRDHDLLGRADRQNDRGVGHTVGEHLGNHGGDRRHASTPTLTASPGMSPYIMTPSQIRRTPSWRPTHKRRAHPPDQKRFRDIGFCH